MYLLNFKWIDALHDIIYIYREREREGGEEIMVTACSILAGLALMRVAIFYQAIAIYDMVQISCFCCLFLLYLIA